MKKLILTGISRRFIRVWQRNFTVYRQNWKISFITPMLEPLFYLLAFGVGLSMLVGKIHFQGYEISYPRFIAPALIAINIMNTAFFENTYSSFVRMYYQKTFDAMMATPLTLEEIITGEIIWGATKAVIATAIMLLVISLFGLIRYPHGLLVIPLAFIGGIAFGSIGMFFTGIVPRIEQFNLPVFLFITPMFLFSGTFFPIKNLPFWAQHLAVFLPLTHLVRMTRSFSLGLLNMEMLWGFGYFVIVSLIFFPLAINRMRRRLIK
ncbi:MAG: ABC transporter permease [Syntrophaceae bacterium CG2_30_49_12]|nr:MAG: ABC transporter permease [Syntrophaceae bacterium CG2_30_49_12]PIP06738.1 MAG: ABC transporter permease [Syntrophobacterales bacterium CG23_combo_of_CG06-09_8_20_14_all_48_27]PJA48080.1 MAG: ABC transporter permease [Syntrophobacterales bacterium CG_4_9_14_3_um_filter_49_8]PJC74002.1 MAG: ABC transporter permease [Syntrophobacterales bacterium CG_4_8_14_3_um_filter_49_14]